VPEQNRVRILAFALLVACGGGTSATKDDGPPTGGGSSEPTEEEKFQAAHYQACEYMCSLATRCAEVSLKALDLDELSPDDRAAAESIGPRELEANTRLCVSDCQNSELSVRQVKAIRNCVSGMPTEGEPPLAQCEEYVSCLDAAQPK
jgi:hypothetical protein